jgi:hypothetical protein
MRALLLFLIQANLWAAIDYGGSPTACPSRPCVYTITCASAICTEAETTEIQTAVNNAQGGDTIMLQANRDWTTSATARIWLDRNPGGTGRVVITTTELAKLPPKGTRITPAYSPLTPRFILTPSGTGAFFAVASGFDGSASRTPGVPGAHWELRGLRFWTDNQDPLNAHDITSGFIRVGGSGNSYSKAEGTFTAITVSGNVATVTAPAHGKAVNDRVRFSGFTGTGAAINGVRTIASVPDANTYTFAITLANGTYTESGMYYSWPADVADLPSDIVISQCIFEQGGLTRVRRDIYLNSGQTEISDSWITAGRGVGTDTQHILALSGRGPLKIWNNYMAGSAAENIMIGGGANHLDQFVKGIDFKFNYLAHIKEQAWRMNWSQLRDSGQYVFRGRVVVPNTSSGYRYIAINTTPGKPHQTVEPSWSTCVVVGCTLTDGTVTWQRVGATSSSTEPTIKNNFEIKSSEDWDSRYNVFDGMWVAEQEHTINIKAETQSLFPTFLNNCVPTTSGIVDVAANGVTVTDQSGNGIFPWISAATINGASGPLHTLSSFNATNKTFTVTPTLSLIQNNLRVVFFGTTLPTGISANTLYWVRGVTGSPTSGTFKASTTSDDTGIITPSDIGSGVTVGFVETTGRLIQINGTWRRVSSFDGPTQLTLADSMGGALNDVPYTYGALPDTRVCQSGSTLGTIFSHNVLRNQATPFSIFPGTNVRFQLTDNPVIKHNLSYNTDPLFWVDENGATYHTSTRHDFQFLPSPSKTVIENNTMIGPNSHFGIYPDNSSVSWPGDSVIRNNIFDQRITGAVRSSHTSLQQYFCGNTGSCPVTQWDQNIFSGAALNTYTASPGRTYNLCGGTATNTSCAAAVDYSLVFEDYSRGDYRVKNTSTFKRAGVDGSDLGADYSQLPLIKDLRVDYTDRAMLLNYTITGPASEYACVGEVSTRPDFGTYAAELGNIGTYYRQDSDAHDRSPGTAYRRTLSFGHTVNLTANTLYFWRLSCPGDVRTGSFTTEAAKSGNVTVSATWPLASNLLWGYSYSRATDTLSGGGTIASCPSGVCSVTATAGRVIYYRFGASGEIKSMALH